MKAGRRSFLSRLLFAPPLDLDVVMLLARRTATCCLALAWCFAFILVSSRTSAADEAKPTPEQEKFFEEKVRPLLVTKCQKCHGAEKQESALRLDSRAGLLKGGEISEASVVVGEPEKSPLIKAVRHEGDVQMPPKEKLPDSDIETLAAWVKMGAPWPNSPDVKILTKEERLRDARASLWSLQPITEPAAPAVKNGGWVARPLDAFVLARLEAAGLTPSPTADKRTLIRRATFDLHGLPPTPEEVEAFVKDESPEAYKTVIERLLSSPRYGERWGRHWLDVARYADTSGYAFMRERRYPYSYTYRDWVIEALNNDVPYDQFILQQLAADKLPPTPDSKHLAALGFLTVGRKFNNRNDDIDDQIDAVSRGLLGLTVACARCHDHKYDAIPQEDYYSLYGVFASSNQPAELPLIGKPADTDAYKNFQAKLEQLRGEVNTYLDQRHVELVTQARERAGEYLERIISIKPEDLLSKRAGISLGSKDLKPRLVERWNNYLKDRAKPEHALLGFWHDVTKLADVDPKPLAERITPVIDAWLARPEGTGAGQINPLLKAAIAEKRPTSKPEVAQLYGRLMAAAFNEWKAAGANAEAEQKLAEPQKQVAQLVVSADAAPSIPRDQVEQYLPRDQRDKKTELQRKIDEHQVNDPGAPPRAMVVVDEPNIYNPRIFLRGDSNRQGEVVPRRFLAMVEPDRKPYATGGRLELAQAIVAPSNPLTARVLANRVWMHHCSEPLVTTPGDFGVRSEKPVQADLLDYLANYVRTHGWSLKELHREIMLSSTYQQASADRADCRTADPENRLYWKMNRRRLEFEALRDSLLAVSGKLDPTPGGRPVEIARSASNRRSIYGFIDRQDLPNLFRVFDVASPDTVNDRRARTTVPQQALFLMNNAFVIEQAKSLVARQEVATAAAPADKINALYRLIYERAPSSDEAALGQQFIDTAAQNAAGAQLSPWEQYAQLLLLTNEFAFVD
jgi:mono/diheme cytochrome c family protein